SEDTTSKGFQVCEESTEGEKKECYDSFKVCQTERNTSPLLTDRKEDGDQKQEFSSFQVQTGGERTKQDYPMQTQNGTTSFQDSKINGFSFHHFHQISSLSNEGNMWSNSEALDNLIKMLKQPSTFETLEAPPSALLFEALFA
ncbi:unnamed protein product, partial [Callosobruchus maculatus]